MLGPLRFALLTAALSLLACSGASTPDGGPVDSGQQTPVPDSGDTGGGCASEGQACAPVSNPCCLATCDDGVTQYAADECDPGSNTCIPIVQPDGGNPDSVCPGATPDAGTSGGTGGGPSPNCAVWQVQTALAGVASLSGLSVPSPWLQIAAGTGAGQGQLLAPVDAGSALPPTDGGLYPPDASLCPPFDAGLPNTWLPLPGVPDAGGFLGVWADSAGDLFAVGQGVGGGGLFVAGNADAGLQPLSLAGLPSILSLTSVVGLGPTEAVAGGFTTNDNAIVLHLIDGGLVSELPKDAGFAQINALAANGGGLVYALATDVLGNSQVLQRTAAGWNALPPPTLDSLNTPVLENLCVGPDGDLWVVGSDGAGDGLAFNFVDGGFAEADLYGVFGTVLPLTAVHETAAGELFIAAIPPTTNPDGLLPQMLHRRNGVWDYEKLPAEITNLTAIADDGVGDLFAVGGQEGVTQDANPDAGTVASVPLILQRLIP